MKMSIADPLRGEELGDCYMNGDGEEYHCWHDDEQGTEYCCNCRKYREN